MKTKLLIITLLLLSLVLSGCNQKNVEIDTEQLLEELQEQLPFADQLSPIKENMIYHLYPIDSKNVMSITVLTSSGATAEEIAIIQTSDVEEAKKAIDQRIETKRNDFANYLPKEVEKLKDPVIVTKGNYVILCISDDSEKARTIIEKY